MTGVSMGAALAVAEKFPCDRHHTVVDVGAAQGSLIFFADPLPAADVVVMCRILHDWSLDQQLQLLRKAYEALPDGGALVVYESVIDYDRRAHTFGLLMSVNMLIETPDGFYCTAADCRSWMADVRFRDTHTEPLAGSNSMVVGIK